MQRCVNEYPFQQIFRTWFRVDLHEIDQYFSVELNFFSSLLIRCVPMCALFHIHNSEGWTFKLNGLNVKTSRTNEIESYKRQHTDCNGNNNNKKDFKIIITNTNKIDQIFILFSIFYWAIKWKMFQQP